MALDDDGVSDSVKLQALRDALDRGGVSAKTSVELEVGPTPAWKEVLDVAMGGGSRAESRARHGIVDDEAGVLDAEVVHLDDADESVDLLDGAGNGRAAPAANHQVPQPDLDTAEPNVGSSTGTGSGTGPNRTGQRRTGDLSGSGVESKIISLEAAHPDDEPPRRFRTNERNRAITPKMTNVRRTRRHE